MAVVNFDGKLKGGEVFERMVRDFINPRTDHWFEKVQGYCTDWDLYCGHCRQGIECKSDGYINLTKNYCFELPLLKHSKARWLFYGIHDNATQLPDGTWQNGAWQEWCYMVEMDPLRQWLREQLAAKNGKVKATRGGDQNHPLYLVKRWLVKEIPTGRFVNLQKFNRFSL